jgi:hypothetical protein
MKEADLILQIRDMDTQMNAMSLDRERAVDKLTQARRLRAVSSMPTPFEYHETNNLNRLLAKGHSTAGPEGFTMHDPQESDCGAAGASHSQDLLTSFTTVKTERQSPGNIARREYLLAQRG